MENSFYLNQNEQHHFFCKCGTHHIVAKHIEYNVPHCQDHLKNILIPPIYDTLSNISLASNL